MATDRSRGFQVGIYLKDENTKRRYHWLRGLRRGCEAALLLGLRVRIERGT
jgi:hypothetical protein